MTQNFFHDRAKGNRSQMELDDGALAILLYL